MNTNKCIVRVYEPWDYSTILYGTLIKKISSTAVLFKSDEIVTFGEHTGYILLLKTRYADDTFDLPTVTVGGALLPDTNYEGKDETYLLSHSVYVMRGSLEQIPAD